MNHAPTPLLGCTYWPTRQGIFFWNDPDDGEITDELAHFSDMGGAFVRLLLPWETFQPNAERINTKALDVLGRVLDVAHECKVGVVPVLFTGVLFGQRFLPRWVLQLDPTARPFARTVSEGREQPHALVKNIYENRHLLDAQRRLITEVVGYFGEHPAIQAWDLSGNGLPAYVPPRTPDALVEWAALLRETAAEAEAGRHPIWLTLPDTAVLLAFLPWAWDLTREHLHILVESYPHTSPAAEEAPADFVTFMAHLWRTVAETAPGVLVGMATAPNREREYTLLVPTECEESPPISIHLPHESVQAHIWQALFETLGKSDVPWLVNATFADVPPAFWETPPFDTAIRPRFMGLLASDGREKEAVQVWRDATFAADKTALRPLDVDIEALRAAPQLTLTRWFRQFREGEV
nr:hypothetical protein [Ardenticatena sp.]